MPRVQLARLPSAVNSVFKLLKVHVKLLIDVVRVSSLSLLLAASIAAAQTTATDEWTWMGGSNTLGSSGAGRESTAHWERPLPETSPEAVKVHRAGPTAAAISGSLAVQAIDANGN